MVQTLTKITRTLTVTAVAVTAGLLTLLALASLWGIVFLQQTPVQTSRSYWSSGATQIWLACGLVAVALRLKPVPAALFGGATFGVMWFFLALLPHIRDGSDLGAIFWYGLQPAIFASFFALGAAVAAETRRRLEAFSSAASREETACA